MGGGRGGTQHVRLACPTLMLFTLTTDSDALLLREPYASARILKLQVVLWEFAKDKHV